MVIDVFQKKRRPLFLPLLECLDRCDMAQGLLRNMMKNPNYSEVPLFGEAISNAFPLLVGQVQHHAYCRGGIYAHTSSY